MKLHRRHILHLAAAATALPVVSRIARAQGYPTRPVHWIVSFTAGGPNDTVARIIGQFLSERLGQQFVIENKVGAGGNIGMAAVLGSPPDGYTVGFAAPNNAINTSLYEKLPFDFIRDSVPVAGTMLLTNVMVVHPDVPARTVAEFIAYAKANPGKINMASSGSGTSVHMSGELFKAMTGIEMQHVPYRGSAPAMQDLLTNRVQVLFDNLPGSIVHIKAGALRALGVTAPSVRTRFRMCRRSARPCRAMRQLCGTGSWRRRARRPRSLTRSIRRSMRCSPIRSSRRALRSSAARRCR